MTPKSRPSKGPLIAAAAIISVVLYLAGVISGLYANKILERRTQSDIAFLTAYVGGLEDALGAIQLEQGFLESLDENETCSFSALSMDDLVAQLSYYWDSLPARVEAYESGRNLSDEYLAIKRDYTRLSLRAWSIARNTYRSCRNDMVPVLYFYAPACEACVEQGENLDELRSLLSVRGQEPMVFTVDMTADESFIRLLRQYYEVRSPPAVIINDRVFQGRSFDAYDFLNALPRQEPEGRP